MFYSPSLAYQSPSHSLTSDQANSFIRSPSDSQVPRTPNVERLDVSVDQSVPLTPINIQTTPCYDSPRTDYNQVPSTPEISGTLPTHPLSPLVENKNSPQVEKSCNTTPNRPDQLVPSTPRHLKGRTNRDSPCYSDSLCLSTTPAEKDGFEPIGRSQMSPDTHCFLYTSTPTSESGKVYEDSGYMSASSNHKNETRTSKCTDTEGTAFLSWDNDRKDVSDQTELVRPRKVPPPSRRRLSLGRNVQGDTLRRKAHQNLAVQRCSTGSNQTDGLSSTLANQTLSVVDILDSTGDAGSDNLLTEPSCSHNLAQKESKGHGAMPLMSPAGDAASFLVPEHVKHPGKRREPSSPVRNHNALGSEESSRHAQVQVEKPKDILDVCDRDDNA